MMDCGEMPESESEARFSVNLQNVEMIQAEGTLSSGIQRQLNMNRIVAPVISFQLVEHKSRSKYLFLSDEEKNAGQDKVKHLSFGISKPAGYSNLFLN